MFAPDHEAVARELARVTAPGWPHCPRELDAGERGSLGDLQDHGDVPAAPPPSSPFDWGDEQRVKGLLGESFDLELEKYISPLQL